MRYRYAPRALPMVLAWLFFGVCSVFYVYRAQNNDRGLVVNGLIELEVGTATGFYWALAACSAGFVAIASWGLFARWTKPRYLELDESGLSIPGRFGRRDRRIEYASVRGIQLMNVSGQRFVRVTSGDAEVSIAGVMLTTERELDEVAAALRERVRASRG